MMAEPDTSLSRRFGSLKGRDVKPVSETMRAFSSAYSKPVLPQYRTLVNDLLQSVHLTTVDARFKFDSLFCLGLWGAYNKLMKAYPGAGEADTIFNAMVSSLDLEPAKVKSDAESLLAWAKSTSKSDLEAALRGEGSGPLADIAKAAKEDEFYLYSKMWGVGLIQLMDAVGVETSEENLDGLMAQVGMPAGKAKQDLVQYKDMLERTAQVRQRDAGAAAVCSA
jgi:photosystem II biogenesis protein Psp29